LKTENQKNETTTIKTFLHEFPFKRWSVNAHQHYQHRPIDSSSIEKSKV